MEDFDDKPPRGGYIFAPVSVGQECQLLLKTILTVYARVGVSLRQEKEGLLSLWTKIKTFSLSGYIHYYDVATSHSNSF